MAAMVGLRTKYSNSPSSNCRSIAIRKMSPHLSALSGLDTDCWPCNTVKVAPMPATTATQRIQEWSTSTRVYMWETVSQGDARGGWRLEARDCGGARGWRLEARGWRLGVGG